MYTSKRVEQSGDKNMNSFAFDLSLFSPVDGLSYTFRSMAAFAVFSNSQSASGNFRFLLHFP